MSFRVENVSFAYHPGQPVLEEVTLDVPAGHVTGLFGPNGSGKSTLLRCLNGAIRPQAGRILLEGRPLDNLSPREIAARIAVVPQEAPANVPFRVREIVMMGRFPRWDFWGQETREDRRAVQAALERVGALDLADRPFDELSGGERQRVTIARALAQQTRVLLLDEPASHLDIAHQLEVHRLARTLAGEGHTVLMVCHDLVLAPLFVQVAVLLKAGRIFSQGTVPQVLTASHLAACFNCTLTLAWPNPGAVSVVLPDPA